MNAWKPSMGCDIGDDRIWMGQRSAKLRINGNSQRCTFIGKNGAGRKLPMALHNLGCGRGFPKRDTRHTFFPFENSQTGRLPAKGSLGKRNEDPRQRKIRALFEDIAWHQ